MSTQKYKYLSFVDKCTRKVWLIKAKYKNEYYINKLIYNYIIKNDITVKSIITDNGIKYSFLENADKIGVKLYKCAYKIELEYEQKWCSLNYKKIKRTD